MSLFDRLKKSSDPIATATIANFATDEGESVAIVAKIAVATPPNEKSEIPFLEKGAWNSPLFGRLEAGPVLEMTETHFSLIHPLTGERVTLSREWLTSLDERAAIMEHDGGISRGEADKQAKIEFFGLFRKGGGWPCWPLLSPCLKIG